MFCILGSDFIEMCRQHLALKLTNFFFITELLNTLTFKANMAIFMLAW